MICEDLRQVMDAYLDDELDVLTAAQFDRHLAACTACKAAYTSYQQKHEALKANIPYFALPKDVENRIRASIRETSGYQDQPVRGSGRPFGRTWVVAAAVISVLSLSGLIFDLARRPSPSETLAHQVVSSHIRSLMANHLSDVDSTDRHTVKPWFSGKLDFAPVVEDLTAAGFPLAGGRLDYLDNHPAAALVYKRRQHTINLFLWPSTGSDSNLQTTASKGFNTVHWVQANMEYWAVSDVNAADLKEFARDLIRVTRN